MVNNLLEKFGSKPSSGPFNFKLKKTLNSSERDKSEPCSLKSEAEKCTEPMATCLQMENCEKTIMHQQKSQERYSILLAGLNRKKGNHPIVFLCTMRPKNAHFFTSCEFSPEVLS